MNQKALSKIIEDIAAKTVGNDEAGFQGTGQR